MVVEMRNERTELDNQRHFTEPKHPIETVRAVLDKWTVGHEPRDPETAAAASATAMSRAAQDGLFEVG